MSHRGEKTTLVLFRSIRQGPTSGRTSPEGTTRATHTLGRLPATQRVTGATARAHRTAPDTAAGRAPPTAGAREVSAFSIREGNPATIERHGQPGANPPARPRLDSLSRPVVIIVVGVATRRATSERVNRGSSTRAPGREKTRPNPAWPPRIRRRRVDRAKEPSSRTREPARMHRGASGNRDRGVDPTGVHPHAPGGDPSSAPRVSSSAPFSWVSAAGCENWVFSRWGEFFRRARSRSRADADRAHPNPTPRRCTRAPGSRWRRSSPDAACSTTA